jgi:uracil-DNA glycosylase family 4
VPKTSTSMFAALQAQIRQCTRCVDAEFITVAAPILRGNTAARVMVIGQAPGPTAIERPWPYSGASGKTLQLWLARAGFDDSALHDPDRFYLTSLTKCFPGKASQGAGDRAPGRQEIDLCAPHLDAELAAVQPEIILSLGRLSTTRMLPSTRKLSLYDIVGVARPAEYPAAGSAIVLGLPHPSGVSRWLNDEQNRTRLHLALDWLGEERLLRGW